MKDDNFVKREERMIGYEWKHYRMVFVLLVILLTVDFYLSGLLQSFLSSLGEYGYIGGLVSGFLFTYGITTPFAIAAFIILANGLDMWVLTLLGSIGGMFSEYLIYDIARKRANRTLIVYKSRRIRLPKIKSKLLKKLSPLIAGFIIASPLPDEFAAVLFGMEKYRLRDFLILAFVFKFIGILFIVGLGRIF